MTVETLTFLRDLLAAQTLPVGAPDFAATAHRIVTALEQLDAAIGEAE